MTHHNQTKELDTWFLRCQIAELRVGFGRHEGKERGKLGSSAEDATTDAIERHKVVELHCPLPLQLELREVAPTTTRPARL
jgi:hypothetical protein